ncbi:MAG: polysaccharide deacetylase family protein [Calditrichia bacterium]
MIKSIILNILEKMNKQHLLLARKPQREKVIYITFDDGPHPENTKEIFSILNHFNIPATFFWVGKHIEQYQDSIPEKFMDFHVIGNHSYNHDNYGQLKIEEIRSDIIKTESILDRLKGAGRTKLIRFPYVKYNFKIVPILKELNLRLVGWTYDSNDSEYKSQDSLIRFLHNQQVKNGDIVLFHEDYAHSIEALPVFIELLKKQGFSFSSIN